MEPGNLGNRNLGNTYSDLNESKKAIEYHEQVLEIAEEIGDRIGEGIWLGNLDIEYLHKGEVDKSK